ncbi:hypothetical protein LTR85_001924 [Meristemomyces frigidus]|nr:hypothetical protein LTR85_001924 [Meristemomyces frigidus]
MCFVGYVYYACGHKRIFSLDCEINLASQHPYYIRHACPNARFDSSHPPRQQCGIGKFYCSESRDGPFLDHACQTGTQAATMLGEVDIQLAKLKVAAQHFAAAATERNIPQESWKTISSYITIDAAHFELMQKRAGLEKTQLEARTILQQAYAHYQRFGQQQQQLDGAGSVPSFVPSAELVSRVPAELKFPQNPYNNAPQQLDAGISDTSSSTSNNYWQPGAQAPPSHNPYAPRHQMQMPPSPVGSHITAASKELYNTSMLPPEARRIKEEQRAEAYRQNRQMQAPQSVSRKGGRPRKYAGDQDTQAELLKPKGRNMGAGKQDSMQEEADRVRRSARVRGKKVNYAESGGSDAGSREPSPDKSDASGFSPAKSDTSASPSKGRSLMRQESRGMGLEASELRRSSSSLVDKISDFKRRNTMAGPGTPMQRRAMPDMRDLLNSSPGQPMQQGDAIVPPRMQFTGAIDTYHAAVGASNAQYLRDARARQAQAQVHAQHAYPSYGGPVNTLGPQYANLSRNFGPQVFHNQPLLSALHQATPPNFQQSLGQGQYLYQPTQSMHQTTPMARGFSVSNMSPNLSATDARDYGDTSGSVMTPSGNNNVYSQPTMARPFATPNMAPTMPAHADMPYVTRKDSVLAPSDGNVLCDGHTPSNYAYDRMRRSFSSTAALTPPAHHDPAAASVEPRKRSVPGLSPTQPSNKRLRLSLPGEDDAPLNVYDTESALGMTNSMSTPKAPCQELSQFAQGSAGHVFDLGQGLSTTPAPVLPPTALMYPLTEQEEAADGEGDGAEEKSSNVEESQDGGDEGEHDPHGLDFSDIDWDAVNNDTVLI